MLKSTWNIMDYFSKFIYLTSNDHFNINRNSLKDLICIPFVYSPPQCNIVRQLIENKLEYKENRFSMGKKNHISKIIFIHVQLRKGEDNSIKLPLSLRMGSLLPRKQMQTNQVVLFMIAITSPMAALTNAFLFWGHVLICLSQCIRYVFK